MQDCFGFWQIGSHISCNCFVFMSITGHEKLNKLDKLKIVNLKRENRDREKVLKQGEDSGTFQDPYFDCFFILVS